MPSNPADLMRQADAAHRAGDLRSAERMYRTLLALQPTHPETLFRLGTICESTGRSEDAVAMYRASAAGSETVAAPHAALGTLLERMNRIEEAQRAIATALRIDGRFPQALVTGARLSRRTGNIEQAKKMLEVALKRTENAPPRFIASVHLELAQTFDEAGQPDDAFRHCVLGKTVWAEAPETKRFKIESLYTVIEPTRAFLKPGCTSGWSDPGVDPHGPAPVFFVGFPRSGTTLTEQMLASHPALVGTDEAPFTANMVKAAAKMLGAGGIPEFLNMLGGLTDEQIGQLRAGYWEQAERVVRGVDLRAKRLVDKVPLNIMSLPIIRRVFPAAKVIMAIRDPRDVCLSCFMQQFEPNPAMVHFARLDTTAALYAGVMDCWLGARDHLGLDFLESKYEDLTADPERAARQLIAFLGLEWDDRVMEYRKRASERAISTPSYRAVSEPVNTRAVARWTRYESHLAPILPTLEPYVRTLGYQS